MTQSILITSAALKTTAGTFPLSVKAATVTLDEGWAPYVQLPLTIAVPSPAVLDALDPRDPAARVTVTARRQVPALGLDQTRSFDLGLRSRSIDHAAAEVAIELASDEALLQDWARYADTTSKEALPYQSSMRGLVNAVVLAKIGAALQAGTADADFTTLTSVTNLILNPSAELTANEWTQGGGCTIARVTTQHYVGVACIAATATNTSCAVFANNTTTYMPATAGKTYTGQMWGLPNATGMTMAVTVRYLDANNNTLLNATGTAVPLVLNGGWTRVRSATAVAPAGTARIALYASITGTAAGRITYLDAAMLVEGDAMETDTVNPLGYFDGSSPDTALYNYDWANPGTPHASQSTRTPVFQRDPQTLWLEPGQSLWDFISAALDQAGLRLFCDEKRKWWLVDSSYAVPGRVTVAAGFNAYGAEDTIARDATNDAGEPSWFDAVILAYTWNDNTNTERTAYDLATTGPTPTRVLRRDIAKPFPGPGAAAYILKRANGRGRQLSLPAALDLTATPGMVASATVPFTPVQTGYVSSVKFDLADDSMTVGTRGLTDTQPSAWVYLAPGQRWIDSPAGASWIAEAV